jgi:hypothetical protein
MRATSRHEDRLDGGPVGFRHALGLSREEYDALNPADQASCKQAAARELILAGAHHVIDSVTDLPPIRQTRLYTSSYRMMSSSPR